MITYDKTIKASAFILGIAAIILFVTTTDIKIAVLSGIVSVTFIQNQINKLIKS